MSKAQPKSNVIDLGSRRPQLDTMTQIRAILDLAAKSLRRRFSVYEQQERRVVRETK